MFQKSDSTAYSDKSPSREEFRGANLSDQFDIFGSLSSIDSPEFDYNQSDEELDFQNTSQCFKSELQLGNRK